MIEPKLNEEEECDLVPSCEGRRKRKKIQHFGFEKQEEEESKQFLIPEGRGIRLGDIPQIAEVVSNLTKKDDEILKGLYQAMYSQRYAVSRFKQVKSRLLDFNGLASEPISDEMRKALKIKLCKWMANYVTEIMDILMIDRSKKSFEAEGKNMDKETKIDRLIDWLDKPCEPSKKARSKSSVATKGITKKRKKETTKRKKLFSGSANMLKKSKPSAESTPKASKVVKKMSPSNTETLSSAMKSTIKTLLAESDMETTTIKQLIGELNGKFDEDMLSKKKAIKLFIQANI